jgi:hypothetical protein
VFRVEENTERDDSKRGIKDAAVCTTYENSHQLCGKLRQSEQRMLKVEESRNRPGVAQRVPGGLDSHIFMAFGT